MHSKHSFSYLLIVLIMMIMMVNCVSGQKYGVLNTTLVIGRRTNVPGNGQLQRYHPDDVTELAKRRGKLFMFSAEDYFIMTAEGYPWHRVPRDVVVGKIGYDNFLVLNALRHNVSVVDATNTLLAMHQTDRDGNMAGHSGRYAGYNMHLLGRFNFRAGMTSSSQYMTTFVNESGRLVDIEVQRRPKKNRTGTARPKTKRRTTTISLLSNEAAWTAKPKKSRTKTPRPKTKKTTHTTVRVRPLQTTTKRSRKRRVSTTPAV